MGLPRARTRIRKRAGDDGYCCPAPGGRRELALWSPNPPTLDPAGNSWPVRRQVLSDALAVPYVCPALGLGLRAAGSPRPSADLRPNLAGHDVLQDSRPAGGRNGIRAKGDPGFNSGPVVKRMRPTDPFSHQLIPFPTTCSPRPPPRSPALSSGSGAAEGGGVSSQRM